MKVQAYTDGFLITQIQQFILNWKAQSPSSFSPCQLLVSVPRLTAEGCNEVMDPCCVGHKVFLVDDDSLGVRSRVDDFVWIARLRILFFFLWEQEEIPLSWGNKAESIKSKATAGVMYEHQQPLRMKSVFLGLNYKFVAFNIFITKRKSICITIWISLIHKMYSSTITLLPLWVSWSHIPLNVLHPH